MRAALAKKAYSGTCHALRKERLYYHRKVETKRKKTVKRTPKKQRERTPAARVPNQ